MRDFVFIELQNLKVISEKIYDFILKKTQILDQITEDTGYVYHSESLKDLVSYVPEIIPALKLKGLTLDYVVLLIVPEGFDLASSSQDIHIDYNCGTRIVVPIKNCEGSITEFYSGIPFECFDLVTHKNGTKYYKFKPGSSEIVKTNEYELTGALIINPLVPHGIRRNKSSSGPRLSALFGVKESLDHYLQG